MMAMLKNEIARITKLVQMQMHRNTVYLTNQMYVHKVLSTFNTFNMICASIEAPKEPTMWLLYFYIRSLSVSMIKAWALFCHLSSK